MHKKTLLTIQTSTSQDQSMKDIGGSNNALSYSSVELKASGAVFKKEGFVIGSQCIKKIGTDESLTKAINPKDLEVNTKNII